MSLNIESYILENSMESAQLAKTIASTMEGHTFHHHFHILYLLRNLIPKEIATYCEIGSFNGGSFCLMLQNPKTTNLIAIDPFHLFRTAVDILNKNIAKFNVHKYTTNVIQKFSTDPSVLETLKKSTKGIDILFIDGDHSYDAVINDFKTYESIVNPGGFIVFDDYLDARHSPEVRPAVDFLVKEIQENNMPYEIIGSLPNSAKAHPHSFQYLNEFILRKSV